MKDQIGPNLPEKLKDLVNQLIKTDGWLFERRIEKRGGYSGLRFSNHGRKRDPHWDPMDLDALSDGRPSQPGNPRRGQGNGGKKEREKCRRENLCFNCGKSGHRAWECNGRPKRLHIMEDNPSSVIGKKADTITKTQEAQESQGTAQKEPERGVHRDESIPAERKASPGTLKTKAIANKGKAARTKYPWDSNSEDDAKHRKLSWTTCLNDTYPIHRSDKEGSGWFPQGPKRKNKKKWTPWPSWWEGPSDKEPVQDLAHFESLYVMEAPPPYEGRFEVVNWHEIAVVISTRYWTVMRQPPRRVLQYDSDVAAQKEEEMMVLQTCCDPRHADKP